MKSHINILAGTVALLAALVTSAGAQIDPRMPQPAQEVGIPTAVTVTAAEATGLGAPPAEEMVPSEAPIAPASDGGPIPIPDAYATFEGVTLSIPAPGAIANDYHPEGLSFILSQFFAPEHGTLPSIVTNGAFTYVPAPGFVGTDTFRYRLMDANGNFSEFVTVTIEVLPDPNRPPIPISDEYATLRNTELNVPAPGLIANDVDPDGDSFILSQFFAPEHGSLPSIVTNGAFRYVPPTDFTGTDTFRYRLMDEHGAFSEFIEVTVHVVPPGGDTPLAIPDHYATTEGTTLSIPAPGLIANDIDPDGDSFILSQFFAPEHGSLPSIVTNGAFTYVPPPGFVGTDTFRYRLMNSKGNFSEFVTVTIEVLPDPNRPPVPIPDFYGTPMNAELNVPAPGLIANDLDPDGDSFILSQFFAPEHGTLPSIVTNGAFRYVPPSDFTGVDTFRYRLMDEHGAFSEFIEVTVFVGVDPTALPDPDPDVTPPTCEIIALHQGPPRSIEIRLQDTESGLAEVNVLRAQNADVTVPAFTQGTNDPVIVTAARIDNSRGAVVELEVLDVAGNRTVCDPVEATLIAELPSSYRLHQNYPNPFNPSTTFRVDLPEAGHVHVTVHDMLGRLVTTLLDQHMDAGAYEVTWTGTGEDGLSLPSGLYIYRIDSGGFSASRTMMLVK